MKTKILLGLLLALIISLFTSEKIHGIYLSLVYPTHGIVSSTAINTTEDPVTKETNLDAFTMQDRNNKKVTLTPKYNYSISGKVFFNRLYPSFRNKCPYGDIPTADVMVGFGEVTNPSVFENISVSDGSGEFRITFENNEIASSPGTDYIQHHMTSNGLIASNANINNAINKIQKDDMVQIKGTLVDLKVESGSEFLTSNGPSDFLQPLRGNPGANEIIYVQELQINNILYK